MGRARRRTIGMWRWLAMAAWLALSLPGHASADVLYLYDDAGRLTGVIDESGASAGYRYDASGNVIALVRSGVGGPAITSFTPASGGIGAAVTINGTGFSALAADNRVTFNGVPATITSSTATRIVAKVPVGAASGPLTVTAQAVSARSATPFTVTTPDLVPTALTAPATASPRQPISVSWTVANRGNGAAAPRWSDVVYLSPDPMCCRADQVAAAVEATATVAAGQSYSRTRNLPAPGVPAGQYYLIVSVDDGRVVPEGDETNNRRALPITITTANLEPTALTLPTTWTRGQNVSATLTVANRGTGTAYGPWDDGLYLVPEDGPCCDAARLLVDSTHTTALAPGASYSANAAFKVPADVGPGRYHVVLMSDFRGGVTEASEGDNQRRVLVTVTAPDLVTTALTAPATVTTQQSIAVTWTVKNEGDAAASTSWSDRLYLSTRSGSCCLDMTPLATVSRPAALAPGASYTSTKTLTVPNVASGSYWLHVSPDDGLAVAERDETNNVRAIPVTVTAPDLLAASLTAPAAGRVAQAIALGWTVQNAGSGAARAPWSDVVYLSSDPTCCAGDTALATVARSTPLAAGGAYAQTKTVTIPNRPPGAYYLILKVDAAGAVFEPDEANNVRVVPFTIAP